MRFLRPRQVAQAPNYADWSGACSGGPLFIKSRRTYWRYDAAILPKNGYLSMRLATPGDSRWKPRHGAEVLRFYPDHMEFVAPKYPATWAPLLDEVLCRYALEVCYPRSGPNRGVLSVMYPSGLSYPAQRNYSVPLLQGLTIDYRGKCLSDKLPTVTQARKWQTTQDNRRAAARHRNTVIELLGFDSVFTLRGYALPKNLTLDDARKLNTAARSLGYEHVADAWAHDVAIYGELTDEFLVEHREGLIGLLTQAEKERRKR